jgi:hypothetical protein
LLRTRREHLSMLFTMHAASSSCDVLTFRRSPSRSWLRGPTRSCSSCDVHVRPCRWVATFRVRPSTITSCLPSRCLRIASVFRRLRSHPRSGCSVVRSCERPSPPPSHVHASFAPCGTSSARSPSRARVHVRLSTLTAGRTPSAHSPRAREIVSRFDGPKLRSSFCSRTAAPCRTRQSRSCSPCDKHDRVAVRISSKPNTSCDMPCSMKPSRAFA